MYEKQNDVVTWLKESFAENQNIFIAIVSEKSNDNGRIVQI